MAPAPLSATASGSPAASTPPKTNAITTRATGREIISARWASFSASSATSSSSSSSPPTSTDGASMARSWSATSSTQVLVGAVVEAGGQHDLHGRGLAVGRRQGVHLVDSVGRREAGEHVLADGRAVDDGDDVAAARSEPVEPLVDLLGLERRRPVEVGVERGEQGPGGTDAEDQDDEPPGRHAPRGPEGQGCES